MIKVWTLVVLAAGPVAAQEMGHPMGLPVPPMAGDPSVAFLWMQEAHESRVVKGAPYTAEAVTEFTQTLADGNRITRKTESTVARDSEGRTHREHGLPALGALGAAHGRNVVVNDPVAKAAWLLDPEDKVAHKLPMHGDLHGRPGDHGLPGEDGPGHRVIMRREVVGGPGTGEDVREIHRAHPGPDAGDRVFIHREMVKRGDDPADVTEFTEAVPGPGSAKTESLGRKEIEGVEVEGTRTVSVVPAGAVGNEKPLETVSERWYSPQLQAVVSSRHSDPRFGETTYKLTKLTLGEPDRSLFEVPADYKIVDRPGPEVVIRKKEKME